MAKKKTAKKKTAAQTKKAAPPKKRAAPWKSRIVGHRKMDPHKLLQNPYNHRLHPESQRKALAAAIRDIGFIRSVTVNKTTGHIVDGHERVYQAIEDGQPKIDVELIELSEAEEKKALASIDQITEMAEVDPQALETLLGEIGPCDSELERLFADMTTSLWDEPTTKKKAKDSTANSDEPPPEKDIENIETQFLVVVHLESEAEQQALYYRMLKEGHKCRVITQ